MRMESLKQLIHSLKEEEQKLIVIQQQVRLMKNNVIEESAKQIQQDAELVKYLTKASENENLEQVLGDVLRYQIHHLEYGLLRIAEELKFYETILREEEGERTDVRED